MTQEEFESLYGKKVQVSEFEVINAMYMLDENETKQEFVERMKKANAAVMLANFAEVLSNLREQHSQELAAMSDRDCKVLNKLQEHEKELEGANEYLTTQLAEIRQRHYAFVANVAVSAHMYDNENICKACAGEMETKQYFRTLLAAGCTPTKTDLDIIVESFNN